LALERTGQRGRQRPQAGLLELTNLREDPSVAALRAELT